MTFDEARRERYLDESSYRWNTHFTLEKSLPSLTKDISDESLDRLDQIESLWRLSSELLDHAARLYSAGEPVADLKPHVHGSVANAEKFVAAIGDGADWPQLDLAIQTHYVHALWLLSLAVLLGLGADQIERVANIYAADESNDGADELFEALVARLGRKSFPAEGLIHDDPYQPLLNCIKAEPEERPALMTQFLKRWFKGQKECDWWGMHVNRTKDPVLKTGFFGYWAFEAALVTYLWDIDDSSYRDLPHYPKDLVEYARQHAAAVQVQLPTRVPGGERCPRAGWWFTPAGAGSRQRFELGQSMPEVGGDYGATIWQWDVTQD